MRAGLTIATGNWRARPGRAAGTVVAIALGVGTVVWVTGSYESVRKSLMERVVDRWVGRSHLSVESPLGHWGQVEQSVVGVAATIPGVERVTARLRMRMRMEVGGGARADGGTSGPRLNHGQDARATGVGETRLLAIDAVGIDPETEYLFRHYDVTGRLIAAGDGAVAMIEEETSETHGVTIGDTVWLADTGGEDRPAVEVVGIFRARRVAKFQQPMVVMPLRVLQDIAWKAGKITAADIIVSDPTATVIEGVGARLRGAMGEDARSYQIVTATARVNQVQEAQRQTEFAFLVVGSIALLTAFFVITATMSMGVVERVRTLGVLRCVGVTRGGMASLVLNEVAPLGVVGLLAGVPVGMGLCLAATWIVPEYVQTVEVSRLGVAAALIGGALTTVGAGLLPAWQAARVSPIDATRPQARPESGRWVTAAAVLGGSMVGVHTWMVHGLDPSTYMQPLMVIISSTCLYVGYALTTPLAVRVAGHVLGTPVARLLGLQPVLLHEQAGRASWRGGGVCCGLIVGLALLIGVVVHSASVRAGWDFPRWLAEGFIWTRGAVPRASAEAAQRMAGVERSTVVSDFMCEMGKSKSRFLEFLRLKTTFVAGEADVFLDMAKLTFLEGDLETARRKLRSGGHVLLPIEASRAYKLHTGDRVKISLGDRSAEFEVAGVVQSSALDIAVSYFQAESYMMVAAAHSVLGTLEDARRIFGVDGVTLVLLNFLPVRSEAPARFEDDGAPLSTVEAMMGELTEWGERLEYHGEDIRSLRPLMANWANDEGSRRETIRRMRPYLAASEYTAEHWEGASAGDRWEIFCDRVLMERMVSTLGRPDAIFGSLRELKQQIDKDIGEATLLLAAIPVVALIIAAIGVGNLMTANVINRTREIGVLRSVGATRGQVTRLVLAEALTLGIIGSAVGVVAGLHAAHSTNVMTLRVIGFAPALTIPWGLMAGGIGLTVGVCVVAGIAPARRAARTEIVRAIAG